jgi:hypothetical protein
MHGLGLYIYAGEDLPEQEEPVQEQPKPRRGGVVGDVLDESPAIPEDQQDKLRELALTVIDDINAYGAQAAYERIEEQALDDLGKINLRSLLDPKVRRSIKDYSMSLHADKAKKAA